MTIPKYDELYDYVMGILADEKEYSVPLMDELIINQLYLTDEELNERNSNGQLVIKNRIGWARTYLKKAGLIESKRRSYCNITSLGLEVIEKNQNITNKILMNFDSFREFKSTKNNKQLKLVDIEDLIEETFNEYNNNLSKELLKKIQKIDNSIFKELTFKLLNKMGYFDFKSLEIEKNLSNLNETTGIIYQGKLCLDEVVIHIKHYNNEQEVDFDLLQRFIGVLFGQGINKGIFITNLKFTSNAIEYVNQQNNLNIVLIDGKKLADLMIEYDVGTFTFNKYEIKKIDDNYFIDE
ncbi:restriction endonuclease [Methanobrevibacter millerae]|uniref:Restriction system protein n=1 Tax=Methanobrevibacter millerae TaxID=230361 RepID=A0A1G5WG86_9EURY|nr:winged helix-turn-helix domain-containing protein [Methanobrevibacter millerae]SDA57063.1 restriction system protein [Methanobrevibacter millerae]